MAEIVVFHSGPIVSFEDARSAGSKRFFTGQPCRRGHIDQRTVANKACCHCQNAKDGKGYAKRKAWRAANPGKVKSYSRKWIKENPDKMREIRRNARQNNLPRSREREIRNKRRQLEANPNLYRDNYRKKVERLAGRVRPDRCEVCGAAGRIYYDHCHATGRFRGWLCRLCNVALGHVRDNPHLLRKLARYLERASAKPSKRAPGPLLELMESSDGEAVQARRGKR